MCWPLKVISMQRPTTTQPLLTMRPSLLAPSLLVSDDANGTIFRVARK